jgi:hypothetical protein
MWGISNLKLLLSNPPLACAAGLARFPGDTLFDDSFGFNFDSGP